jgi:hypothetical protein
MRMVGRRESVNGGNSAISERGSLLVWSIGLFCWPDRQTNQKSQIDQIDLTNKTDEPYAALEAALSRTQVVRLNTEC